MTAAEQHRLFGACVEHSGSDVILQVGTELVALTPDEARRFTYYLCREYTRAKEHELHRHVALEVAS